MKLKLDENLPTTPTSVLGQLGHDVHTAGEENLSGVSDWQIWESARNESRFFITQDMDFSDLRSFLPGTHPGILLLWLHAPSRKRLAKRMNEIFWTEDVNGWTGCFVVATEAKIRAVKRKER